MKILAPGIERLDTTGGGSTFLANLKKGITEFDCQLVTDRNDYDALLIAGASLCDRETLENACEYKKPIVLRVDNILEDSRNRNSGMTRLREFAKFADVIVYQSEWAKNLLEPACGKGIVIYNGVDTNIFYPIKKTGNTDSPRGVRVFYAKHSRNEVKRFHEVQYFWREYCLKDKEGMLVLVGRFADEMRKIDHPFEFHNDEPYEYLGIVGQEKMADIMRSCDIAFLPYAFDACSNTILEAQACGLPVLYCPNGGTPEIVDYGKPIDWANNNAESMVEGLKGLAFNMEEFREKRGLEEMSKKYASVFKLLKAGTYEI